MTHTTLIPHNDLWAEFFTKEVTALKKVLRNNLFEVYHIGSTAIPLVPSKPTLDIVVAAHTLDGIEVFNDEFLKLGLKHESTKNEIIEYKRFDKNQSSTLSHIRIFDKSDKRIDEYIDFRDYLNSEDKIAKEFSDLKKETLKQFPTQAAVYEAAKSEFIHMVLKTIQQ